MIGGRQSFSVLLMALGLAVIPTLSIYYPRSLVVPCLLIGAAAIFEGWRHGRWGQMDRILVAAMIALLAWTAVSAFWALDVGFALRDTAGLAATMVVAVASAVAAARMETPTRRFLLWAAVVGVTVAWGFTVMELVFDGVLLRYRSFYHYGLGTVMKPGNTVAVVLAAPAAACLLALGRRRLAWLLLAAWLVVLPFSYSEAAKIGGAGLVGGLVLFRLLPKRAPMLLAAGLAALILSTPLLLRHIPPPQEIWDNHPGLKNSAHHRLAIWRFAGERIVERPVLGWGMNSSRVMPGAEEEHLYQRPRGTNDIEYFHETNLPLHPHNVAVQWWLELGGVGAGLAVLVLAALLRLGAAVMPDASRQGLAVATVTATMGIFLVAYGAWQSWWLSVLALAAMVLALAGRDAVSAES